jgi:hypothetical protein
MTDRKTTAFYIWLTIVMTHNLFLLRVALDGYYCHTRRFISFFSGNKNGKVYSVPEYTHAFFANSELLIKDYFNYLI